MNINSLEIKILQADYGVNYNIIYTIILSIKYSLLLLAMKNNYAKQNYVNKILDFRFIYQLVSQSKPQ